MAASQRFTVKWMDRMRKILQRAANAMAGKKAVCLTVLWIAVFVPFPVKAADIPGAMLSVYTVSDVAVDASAPNAVRAREEALANGQRDAFRILVTRLGAPADRIPVPDPAAMNELVLGVAILEEKTSNVRYIGKAAFTFFPDGVRDLLRKAGFTAVDVPARPLVVLPVWTPSPGAPSRLWDDPNPWKTAWDNRPKAGLVPLDVPLGDLEDVTAIDAARASAMDPMAIDTITQRYQAEDALIAHAEALSLDRSSGLPTEIRIRATRGQDRDATFHDTVPVLGGLSLEAALNEAVTRTVAWLERGWHDEYSTIASGETQTLNLRVHISAGLENWLAVRKALDKNRNIKSWALDTLTRTEALVSATIYGDAERLSSSLSADGLQMILEGEQWVIHPATHTQAPPSSLTPVPYNSQYPE
ncbi:hypothetical protein AY555_06710 [Haematospirillum jordaniae]|uniref:DUF2066 domain-containing protein n=2 Tax=Haematospirillum jordaniae TaxID=1549855 RepID=A0A143DDU7_9PROT|nr:hypothetical protein AY555_06710 [Haematospirillum jordaniae]